MLALEASRPKQSSYFQPMTMDPSMVDMFSFPVEGMSYAPSTQYARVPQSYYDTSVFESDTKPSFPSMPATPPSVSTSQSEPQIPTGSAASGPSIASAPSSALGSPYSGPAPVYQENWVNTSNGLGLATSMMNDPFSNDYMGNPLDVDGLYAEKFPSTFVGMYPGPPRWSSQTNTDSLSRSLSHPTRASWSQLHSDHLLP